MSTDKLDELLPDQWQAEQSKKKHQNTTAKVGGYMKIMLPLRRPRRYVAPLI